MHYLRCPLCHTHFQKNSQGLICVNLHQFDRSKEGYFNLLPVQNKNSKYPGDSKEQLMARRKFLEAGFFEPLKNEIQALLSVSGKSILDLGAGEGYFSRELSAHYPNIQFYAVDVAKIGVAMAAKASKGSSNVAHIVASNYDLPLQGQSMDAVLRILAPSKDSELDRVLRADGCLLIVVPGQQHLIELREKIYSEIRPLQPLPGITGFLEKKIRKVTFEIRLNQPEQIKSLLAMTPFTWKINQKIKDEVLSEGFKHTADFMIGVYEKVKR